MVQVIGTRGNVVDFEIRGIGEVIHMLRTTGKDIESNVDLTAVKLGTFVEGEVKESIAGNRAELKSVDTGTLINSIEMKRVGKGHVVVAPKKKNYPGGKTDTQQVATFMEFGTARGIVARRHFRNTEARQKKKIVSEIAKAVKKATK